MPDALQPITGRRKLPQQDWQKILLINDRFDRDAAGQAEWAELAKTCVEFVEGKQWSADALKQMIDEGRPALTFNKIGPLVRLVLGYYRNNRTDEKFLPTGDELSNTDVATALSKVAKQIAEASQQPYVDAEVFGDGIISGRGYYDWRLDFEENELGEAVCRAQDPFSTYPAADADSYDPKDWSRVSTTRWASLDDVLAEFGQDVRELIEPLITGKGYSGMPQGGSNLVIDEVAPWRRFGGETESSFFGQYGSFSGFAYNLIDESQKTIRLLEQQYKVRTRTRLVIDLESGLMKPLPDHWPIERVMAFMAYWEDKFASMGKANPLRFDERPMNRIRWTTLCGDIIVHDDWSPYNSYSIVPFFPYFRRGKTRGMVDDLLDPQREINKRRSSRADILSRSAKSGWMIHKEAMDDEEAENWEDNSAKSGFVGRWEGDHEPQPIRPGAPPQEHKRLEDESAQDLKDISGVNDSLLGQIDKVQSGRAIEARQRQGVLSIQTYMDNMSRSKELVGRKKLELIQNHYTEQRLIMTLGDDGSQDQTIINERAAAGEIINNVTIGKYLVSIDETPMSSSFLNAQFDELMEMIEKGVLPVEAVMDVAVELSSVPQKEVVKQRVRSIMNAQGIPTGDDVMTSAAGLGAGGGIPGAGGGSMIEDGSGNVVPLGPRGVPGPAE